MNDRAGLVLIAAGAVVMALNLFRFRTIAAALPFVDRATGNLLRRLIQAHGVLIALFLVGYVATALAFDRDWQIVGEAFVGLVFASGAAFVHMGLSIQSRFVGALVTVMERLVPMCASCKRVCIPGGDGETSGSWQVVDLQYCHESVFSHGICPDCAVKVTAAPETA